VIESERARKTFKLRTPRVDGSLTLSVDVNRQTDEGEAMEIEFGKIEKVNLRDVWENEERDFTPWLAQEANLQMLGETLQMTLVPVSIEQEVGFSFRADILARNVLNEQLVLIENQLAKADHMHLGQIITYASGLHVNMLVWIAETFTSEHLSAIDWLNGMTNERLSFFAVEIELWKIGDSLIAPKFNVVAKPNKWLRKVEIAVRTINASSSSDSRRTSEVRRKTYNQQFIAALYAKNGWSYFTKQVKDELSEQLGITIRHIDRLVAQIKESTQQCLNEETSEDSMSELETFAENDAENSVP